MLLVDQGVIMPFSIAKHEDQDLTVIVVAGDILSGEPLEALKLFYSGEPTTNVIWDFSAVTKGQITADEIQQIFDHALKNILKRQQGKTALVAPDDHEFGLSRMTSTIGELRDVPWELKAFRDLESAAQWLGVRYPQE